MFLIFLLFTYVVHATCPNGGFVIGQNERDCRVSSLNCGYGPQYDAWFDVCYNNTWHSCPYGASCYTCLINSQYYIRSQHYPIREREMFTHSEIFTLPSISDYKINSYGYAYSNEIYVGHMPNQYDCRRSTFDIDKKIDMNSLPIRETSYYDNVLKFTIIWPAIGLHLKNEPWILIDVPISTFNIITSIKLPINCCITNISNMITFRCDNEPGVNCSYTNDTKKSTAIKAIVDYWYVLAFMAVFVVSMLLIMGVLIYYRMKRNTIMDINDILDE